MPKVIRYNVSKYWILYQLDRRQHAQPYPLHLPLIESTLKLGSILKSGLYQ